MWTGNLLTVSVRAASKMSYGLPSKMPSSRSSHLSRAYRVKIGDLRDGLADKVGQHADQLHAADNSS